MKRLICFVFAAIIFMNGAAALAEGTAKDKLTRGVINIFVSPMEFFKSMSKAYESHDPALAFFLGITKGSWMTLRRFSVGFYETFTFPFPLPQGYAPVIEEPDYLGRLKAEEDAGPGGEALESAEYNLQRSGLPE